MPTTGCIQSDRSKAHGPARRRADLPQRTRPGATQRTAEARRQDATAHDSPRCHVPTTDVKHPRLLGEEPHTIVLEEVLEMVAPVVVLLGLVMRFDDLEPYENRCAPLRGRLPPQRAALGALLGTQRAPPT